MQPQMQRQMQQQMQQPTQQQMTQQLSIPGKQYNRRDATNPLMSQNENTIMRDREQLRSVNYEVERQHYERVLSAFHEWTAYVPLGTDCEVKEDWSWRCLAGLCDGKVNGEVFKHTMGGVLTGRVTVSRLCVQWTEHTDRRLMMRSEFVSEVVGFEETEKLYSDAKPPRSKGLILKMYPKFKPLPFVHFGSNYRKEFIQVTARAPGVRDEDLTSKNSSVWYFKKNRYCIFLMGSWSCSDLHSKLCFGQKTNFPFLPFSLFLCGDELRGVELTGKLVTSDIAEASLWAMGNRIHRHPIEFLYIAAQRVAVYVLFETNDRKSEAYEVLKDKRYISLGKHVDSKIKSVVDSYITVRNGTPSLKKQDDQEGIPVLVEPRTYVQAVTKIDVAPNTNKSVQFPFLAERGAMVIVFPIDGNVCVIRKQKGTVSIYTCAPWAEDIVGDEFTYLPVRIDEDAMFVLLPDAYPYTFLILVPKNEIYNFLGVWFLKNSGPPIIPPCPTY